MDPLGCKIICVFGILVTKLVFGLFPCSFHEPLKRLAARTPARRKYFCLFVECFHCFAAGTLLSMSFLHIFPECQRILRGITGHDLSHNKFPLAEMLTALGIYLLLLIDRSIHCLQRSQCRNPPTQAQSTESVCSTTGYPTLTSYELTRKQSLTEDEIDMSDIIAENHADLTNPKLTQLSVDEHGVSLPVELYLPVEHKEFQMLYVNGGGRKSAKLAIIFVIALSFHSFFSGLALGFQRGAVSVWLLFVGLALREVVHSFSLGLELARFTDKRYQSLFGIAVTATIAAAGVVGGTLLESATYYNTSLISVVTIFQSITNGAILYIVFFDVFLPEMEEDYTYAHVISSLVGFGAMTLCIGILL
ncbi:zinc transporter ZIP3-like [Liolophura sinensis]|uniref:zinc transporter ZIP3-like n=1 Tax=Liolophura sinensis TaxID=3198878 RepID=UPI003158BAD8